MDSQLFLEQFGHLASSVGGVQKLRNLILDLAIHGLLVPQDPNDEPASELLKKIETEKQRLVKLGISKKLASISLVQDSEKPYELPIGWEWTRLATIGEVNPRNNASDDLEVSFIPMTLISEEYGKPPQSEKRLWGEIKKGFTHFAEGDVGLAKITPCFENGKSCVMRNLFNGIGAGTTELHIFRDITKSLWIDYVYLFLKTPTFVSGGKRTMTGSAGQKRVPTTYFSTTPFPLPPLAEQERIVAKVDELMLLCDQLEAEQDHQKKLREYAVKSTLHHLTQAEDKSQAFAYWEQAEDHFAGLFDHPSTIAELRATILQLAVQGRLVPQDPSDEPAYKTLNQHKAIFEALRVNEKVSKKPAQVQSLKENVPLNWHSCRMRDILQLVNGRAYGQQELLDEGTPVIRIQNLNGGDRWYYSDLDLPSEKYCHKGDLLFAWSASFGPYIWKGSKAIFHYHIWRIILSPAVDKKFM